VPGYRVPPVLISWVFCESVKRLATGSELVTI